MYPTRTQLEAIFDKYNRLCFGGSLVRPPIHLNRRKRSMGLTVVRTDTRTGRKSIHIEISVLNDLPESEYIDTMVHEMIHYYIFSNNLKDDATHGSIFRKIMARINRECAVKVTLNYKATDDELLKPGPNWRHFCIAKLRSGEQAILVVGPSKLFDFWHGLKTCFPEIIELRWYISRLRLLDAYPLARTPKLYKITPDRLEALLANAQKLENDGKVIRVKHSPETKI